MEKSIVEMYTKYSESMMKIKELYYQGRSAGCSWVGSSSVSSCLCSLFCCCFVFLCSRFITSHRVCQYFSVVAEENGVICLQPFANFQHVRNPFAIFFCMCGGKMTQFKDCSPSVFISCSLNTALIMYCKQW